ncbi:porin [Roseateles sp. BYS78W]|uniref:Porin n=1 Tax=Pelomonas candidula TaxID=3299025 RepID=A0ABW7HBM7_9BURK
MTKNPFAPAVLAAALAATGAHAQSNVTIYGILDASVEALNGVGANGDSIKRMPGLTGGISPSRIGLRGNEDLGDGLKAVFTLEQGFGVDTGTLNQGGRAWGRQAFVGLQGSWGMVSLGRQYSMLFWSQLEADILGPAMFGSGSLDSYLPNSRVDNSIAYKGTFNGLTVGATYSFGRDATSVATATPSATNCPGESSDAKACRQWSVLAKYDTATWGVSAAVDELRGGSSATFAGLTNSSLTDRRATVAGWARFGDVKLGAGVIDRRNEGSATTPKSQLWYLGASYPVTQAFTLDGEVFKLDYKGSANQATLFAVRGVYTLSKRTAVYATAGRIDNSGTLALGVSNGAAGNGPAAGGGQTGLALGVRHSF